VAQSARAIPSDNSLEIAAKPKVATNLLRLEELCIGITFYPSSSYGLDGESFRFNNYDIYLGARKNFGIPNPNIAYGEGVRGHPLIALKRVPTIWEADLNQYLLEKPGIAGIKALGYIEYRLPKEDPLKRAITKTYEPRFYLGQGKASGVPYFIEVLTTYHLKFQGFRHISTTRSPDRLRREQLERATLQVKQPVSIDEWLMGLGRGIKYCTEHAEEVKFRAREKRKLVKYDPMIWVRYVG
jgi:hypothetical protein